MGVILDDDHRTVECFGRLEDVPNGPHVRQGCAIYTGRIWPQRRVAVAARQRACGNHHDIEFFGIEHHLIDAGVEADVDAEPLNHLDLPPMDFCKAPA